MGLSAMRYPGGKGRCGKRIAAHINKERPATYWEPFCGAISVAQHVVSDHKVLSDANRALIAMWSALASGWSPPELVSEDEHRAARGLPDDDPRKALILFGCSFGADWSGGYARDADGTNYAMRAAASAKKKLANLSKNTRAGIVFKCIDVMLSDTVADVAYLDPPYINTLNAYGGAHLSETIEHVCEHIRDRVGTIFVSERASLDAEVVDSWMAPRGLQGPRMEYLYRWD